MNAVYQLDGERPAWMDQAACVGEDQALFFPGDGKKGHGFDYHKLKAGLAICATCPVHDDCLAYALDNGIKHGTWGGHTERQLRALRKERAQRQAS